MFSNCVSYFSSFADSASNPVLLAAQSLSAQFEVLYGSLQSLLEEGGRANSPSVNVAPAASSDYFPEETLKAQLKQVGRRIHPTSNSSQIGNETSTGHQSNCPHWIRALRNGDSDRSNGSYGSLPANLRALILGWLCSQYLATSRVNSYLEETTKKLKEKDKDKESKDKEKPEPPAEVAPEVEDKQTRSGKKNNKKRRRSDDFDEEDNPTLSRKSSRKSDSATASASASSKSNASSSSQRKPSAAEGQAPFIPYEL